MVMSMHNINDRLTTMMKQIDDNLSASVMELDLVILNKKQRRRIVESVHARLVRMEQNISMLLMSTKATRHKLLSETLPEIRQRIAASVLPERPVLEKRMSEIRSIQPSLDQCIGKMEETGKKIRKHLDGVQKEMVLEQRLQA